MDVPGPGSRDTDFAPGLVVCLAAPGLATLRTLLRPGAWRVFVSRVSAKRTLRTLRCGSWCGLWTVDCVRCGLCVLRGRDCLLLFLVAGLLAGLTLRAVLFLFLCHSSPFSPRPPAPPAMKWCFHAVSLAAKIGSTCVSREAYPEKPEAAVFCASKQSFLCMHMHATCNMQMP